MQGKEGKCREIKENIEKYIQVNTYRGKHREIYENKGNTGKCGEIKRNIGK